MSNGNALTLHLLRGVGALLLFFSLDVFASCHVTVEGFYSTSAQAMSACNSAWGSGSCYSGVSGSGCPADSTVGASASNVCSPNICEYTYNVGPPSSCIVPSGTVGSFSGTGGLSSAPSTVCYSGCTYSESAGVAVGMSSGTWTSNYSSTGAFCSAGNTSGISQTITAGSTPCTKSTLVNGQISYDCGSASTDPAMHYSCISGASGYSCGGGSTLANCYVDGTGTVNCTAANTPTPSGAGTSGDQTVNPDNSKTVNKTVSLPGGGTQTTTTTYDPSGALTGTTVTSTAGLSAPPGSGPAGSQATGNPASGGGPGDTSSGGDGSNDPTPDVPTGSLASTPTAVSGYTANSYFAISSSCPADITTTFYGQTLTFSYGPICQVLGYVYYAMLSVGAFVASVIFFGYIQRATS